MATSPVIPIPASAPTIIPAEQPSTSIWESRPYGISLSDGFKYILEGIAVAVAAFFVSPKNRKDYKSVILIGLSASLVFFIIDKFAPKVAAGTRQGSGFGIGFGLVGGGNKVTDGYNVKEIEETYVPEVPTSISNANRAEHFFDYGNAKGNQPLTGDGKQVVVTGTSDFDESTVENSGFENVLQQNTSGFAPSIDKFESMQPASHTEKFESMQPTSHTEKFESSVMPISGFEAQNASHHVEAFEAGIPSQMHVSGFELHKAFETSQSVPTSMHVSGFESNTENFADMTAPGNKVHDTFVSAPSDKIQGFEPIGHTSRFPIGDNFDKPQHNKASYA